MAAMPFYMLCAMQKNSLVCKFMQNSIFKQVAKAEENLRFILNWGEIWVITTINGGRGETIWKKTIQIYKFYNIQSFNYVRAILVTNIANVGTK
jgi:hypothetical protein